MKPATLLSILIIICSCTFGQNLIGYNNAEIRNYMKQNRKDMHFNTVRNSMFSYLKYSDNSDSQTILFFLTPDSVCKAVRVICESTLKPVKIKELDSIYKRISEDKWIDNHDGKNYLIKFKDEEWCCSITIEPDI
jgi:lipopolysaccharide export LptBFGC system permease protein LptF